jgi:hypothetical protein
MNHLVSTKCVSIEGGRAFAQYASKWVNDDIWDKTFTSADHENREPAPRNFQRKAIGLTHLQYVKDPARRSFIVLGL